MNVLVTGASGQLGCEWVGFLKHNNIPFHGFSSSDLDVTNREDIERKFNKIQPDLIINCAAYTDVDGAESEAEKAFSVNETGVRFLAEFCDKQRVKLVHFSTDYVFSGSDEDRTKYPDGYPEEAVTNAINIYGKSKEAGEKVLLNSNCEWLLVRVSWLCGQHGSNFVKTMLKLGSERDDLSIVDDQVGCPSFAFDVVNKTWQLLDQNCEGIYHISCKGKLTWADFAENIFQQSQNNVSVKRISSDKYPFIAERPRFSLLSNNKAEKEGLKMLPFKAGLAKLLEQVKENKS